MNLFGTKKQTEEEIYMQKIWAQLTEEVNGINRIARSSGVDTEVDVAKITFSDTGGFVRYPMTFTASVDDIYGLKKNISVLLTSLRNGNATQARFMEDTLIIETPWPFEQRDLLWSDANLNALHPFEMLLGVNYSLNPPKPVIASLISGTLSHLLFVGASGSGKTVAWAQSLVSLCYATSPDKVRIIIVNPKPHPDFEALAKLPHVQLVKTLEDAQKAVYSVRKELDRRDWEPDDRMVILAIDELSRLFEKAGDSAEYMQNDILSIAKAGRSQHVHLSLATQKPLASIMDGEAKSNLNVRVVGRVMDPMDSSIGLGRGGIDCRQLGGRGEFYCILDGGDLVRMRSYYLGGQSLVDAVDVINKKWAGVTPYQIRMQTPAYMEEGEPIKRSRMERQVEAGGFDSQPNEVVDALVAAYQDELEVAVIPELPDPGRDERDAAMILSTYSYDDLFDHAGTIRFGMATKALRLIAGAAAVNGGKNNARIESAMRLIKANHAASNHGVSIIVPNDAEVVHLETSTSTSTHIAARDDSASRDPLHW